MTVERVMHVHIIMAIIAIEKEIKRLRIMS